MDSRERDREALVRAATLAERLSDLGRVTHPASGSNSLQSDMRARQEFESWRRIAPFDDQRLWQLRLTTEGVDETTLLGILAETPQALLRRLPSLPWLEDAVTLLFADPVDDDETRIYGNALLAPVVAPLLRFAYDEMSRLLHRWGQTSPALSGGTKLLDHLYQPLPALLNSMLGRTLALEINVARARGQLSGRTPEERFVDFIAGYTRPDRRRELFYRYPVLARKLVSATRSWIEAATTLMERLGTDWDDIASFFGLDSDTFVDQIVCALGDRHRGATVARIDLTDGTSLMYKPRSLAVDMHFQDFLGWLNGHGVETPFRQLKVVDKGDYGWAEYVRPEPCVDEYSRKRFYRRQGGLLAALYLLCATDIHAENVIAVAEQPIVVDLETLPHPLLPLDESLLTRAEQRAGEAANGSVLTIGLLPEWDWVNDAGIGVDVSGLGYPPGQRTPFGIPVLWDAGTDTMHIRLQQVNMSTPNHRPASETEPVNLLSYADAISAGFAEVYELCLRHRSELMSADGPVEAFAQDEVRVLRQPTVWYWTVLQTGLHPDALLDGFAHERHLDALWRPAGTGSESAYCIPSERSDLWANDIPIFTAIADRPELKDSAGRAVPGVVLTPGMDRVRERLRELGAAGLERQLWLIKGSLSTTAITADRRVLTTVRTETALPPLDSTGTSVRDPMPLIESADRLGRYLRGLAFEEDDSIQWMGLNAARGGSWSLGPLLPDLFHGLAGVALFYAWLGELTETAEHTTTAHKVLNTIRSQLRRQTAHPSAVWGGMTGIGGIIYTLASLGKLWQDDVLHNEALQYLVQHAAVLDTDTGYDFVSGSAGTIAGLLAMNEAHPDGRVTDCLARAVRRLDDMRIDTPEGTGWLSETIRTMGVADGPIVGFSHGVAGIAWPLFAAADVLDDELTHQTALNALRFEQSRFRPEGRYWRDERHLEDHGISPDDPPEVGWCYGAMGIGLSRLLCLPSVPEDSLIHLEIITALSRTVDENIGRSHCLCHGDLGNSELLLQAATKLGQPTWADRASDLAQTVRADIEAQGWKCGTPLGIQTPSLMVGLAGIGYGLLRNARPDRIPAVLAMQLQ